MAWLPLTAFAAWLYLSYSSLGKQEKNIGRMKIPAIIFLPFIYYLDQATATMVVSVYLPWRG